MSGKLPFAAYGTFAMEVRRGFHRKTFTPSLTPDLVDIQFTKIAKQHSNVPYPYKNDMNGVEDVPVVLEDLHRHALYV